MDELDYKKQYYDIRNILGILGCTLPISSILGALFSPNTKYADWFTSISITYYSSPVLIAILTSVSLFLILYNGYNIWDKIINTATGIAGLFVVSFPCDASWIAYTEHVGLFWLPVSITCNIHNISAGILWILMAINIFVMFTKGNNKTKNIIYRICASLIVLSIIFIIIQAPLKMPKVVIMIAETVCLFSFGTSWLIKGHMFDKIVGD